MNLNLYRKHKSSSLRSPQKYKVIPQIHINPYKQQQMSNVFKKGKDLYYSQTNYEAAIDHFQKYLQAIPNDDEALYLCGVCQIQLERLQSAISKLNRISEGFQLKNHALLLSSIAYNKLGQTKVSFNQINKCLSFSPFFEQALCFRAKLYMQKGDFLKAQLDFKNVIEIDPNSYLGLIGIADCYRYSQKFQNAILKYRKSLISANRSVKKVIQNQVNLKIAICHFNLDQYIQCYDILKQILNKKKLVCSEVYYYAGLCQLKLGNKQIGLNQLEHSIRLQTNKLVAQQAYKKLIISYLQNYQFYEAQKIVKMGKIYNVSLKEWDSLIQSFLLVIRGDHQNGLKMLNHSYQLIKSEKNTNNFIKIKEDYEIDDLIFKAKANSNLFNKKGSFDSSQKKNIKLLKMNGRFETQKKYYGFKIKKSLDKIQSTRINTNFASFQSAPIKAGRFHTEYKDKETKIPEKIFTSSQKQAIFPMLLQFKFYCQFFLHKLVVCIETIEQYDEYRQNIFGKESNVKYSRLVCEALLLIQSQDFDDGILKCNEAIKLHKKYYKIQPLEPLLYKIAVLIKIAVNNILNDYDNNKFQSHEVLTTVLEVFNNNQVLDNSHIAHYYTAFIFVLLDDYEKSKVSLERTLKLSEEYTAKMLFTKGLVETKLGFYVTAFRDLSTALIIGQDAQTYLARSIILFLISEEKESLSTEISKLVATYLTYNSPLENSSQIQKFDSDRIKKYLVEKCLDDLQKFIELCQNDDMITLWVTKMLFVTRSFQQAQSSLQKVTFQNQDTIKIAECLNIYIGQLQKGGRIGLILKSGFDGNFISEQQQKEILVKNIMKDYNSKAYDCIDYKYQKWLIILNLYSQQKYKLCIKYIQKQIFEEKQQSNEIILRFNLMILFFLIKDYEKANTTLKSFSKFEPHYKMTSFIEKYLNLNFEDDECLKDIHQILFTKQKILSSYLSYKPIILMQDKKQVKVYGKICIPFPQFYRPNLELQFDISFIFEQLDVKKIPKKIEAPWINRVNDTIQFTENLNETISSFEDESKNSDKKFHLSLKKIIEN